MNPRLEGERKKPPIPAACYFHHWFIPDAKLCCPAESSNLEASQKHQSSCEKKTGAHGN